MTLLETARQNRLTALETIQEKTTDKRHNRKTITSRLPIFVSQRATLKAIYA